MTWDRSCTLIFGVMSVLACRQNQDQDIPNRVLDRPTDATLACVHVVCEDQNGDDVVQEDEECRVEPLSLNICAGAIGDCTSDYGNSDFEGGPKLVGFVTNSERNEIGLFTKCGGRLVDMDIDVPGYNLIPVGRLPTRLTSTRDGCTAVSANVGSCDLTVLAIPELAGYGLGLRNPEGEPASLVNTVIPKGNSGGPDGWQPLGSRPADILAVPPGLSTAASLGDGGETCSTDSARSIYAAFPSCNLVAEIDLRDGYVLQSFQLRENDDGTVTVVDMGEAPSCPVDCPDQFESGNPGDIPPADSQGVAPQTLELVQRFEPVEGIDPEDGFVIDDADEIVEDDALFVGGLGNNRLFEIKIDADGVWNPEVNSLELDNPGGIERIRATPAMNFEEFGGEPAQYLFVIAGDGSTHVIRRYTDIARDEIGDECDTQVDPAIGTTDPVCHIVVPQPGDEDPADRRAFAVGPGLRAPGGAKVTDWVFRKQAGGRGGAFVEPGVVGIGVTTFGRVVFAMFNQPSHNGQNPLEPGADPAGLMDPSLGPHMLRALYRPTIQLPESLPLVTDEVPERRLPEGGSETIVLAPSLRRIDLAYAEDETVASLFGGVTNDDALGNRDAGGDGQVGLYTEDAPRVAVRDFRSWGNQVWNFEWEAEIPGTTSSTGQILCENLGWEDASCLPEEADDSRLRDTGANFCELGVLAGDKLVIPGCLADEECGAGQRCLRETNTGGEGTGICISAQAFENEAASLRAACWNFIHDDCGDASREYLITKATQDELFLQALDRPMRSWIEALEPCESGQANNHLDDQGECVCNEGFELCTNEDLGCCVPEGTDPALLVASVVEHEGRLVCAEEQPDDECQVHADCKDVAGDSGVCVAGLCQRPCDGPDECMLRRLPGPRCFAELVRYQIRVRNSFLVRAGGGRATYFTDHIEENDEGECVLAAAANTSPLLTSRIPLGPDDTSLGLPECTDSGTSPNPCLITDSRSADSTSTFHTFSYATPQSPAPAGGEITAIRYENPVFRLVIDLTSLLDLAGIIPNTDNLHWPAEFRAFRRSRLRPGYGETFNTVPGYTAVNDPPALLGAPTTYPVRVIGAPEVDHVFIVDSSGPGSVTGIRGQVMRVNVASDPVIADDGFDGVR